MKKIVIYLTFILAPFFALSQGYNDSYDWSEIPKVELSAEEIKENSIIIKEKKGIEIYLNDEKKEFKEFNLFHQIIKLNNDKGVEDFNKYYINTSRVIEILKLKARVIKNNGEIIELGQKDMQDEKDEQGNVVGQYFAFQGIEVGCYVEILTYFVQNPKMDGREIVVQNEMLKKNYEFELISPTHLIFDSYPVNNLKKLEKDSTVTSYNRWFLELKDLKPLKEENWADYSPNLMKFFYKFNKNLYSNKGNFYTYGVFTQDIYASMFAPLTSKEKKGILKILQQENITNEQNVETKLRKLEIYLKNNFQTTTDFFENSMNIEVILKKKIAHEDGLTRIMMNCLRELAIDFELVVTCNRHQNKFPKEFETYNFLQEYLIYIKPIDKYYSSSLIYKIGFVPSEYTYNNGLFIKESILSGQGAGIGKVKFISTPKAEESIDEINTVSKLDDLLSSLIIDVTRKTTGYKAEAYQSFISYVGSEEKKNEFLKEYIAYLDDKSNPENLVFENDNSDAYGVLPLIGKGKITSANFVENAGDKILVKVGGLIGPQAELYNKEKRVLPVSNPFNRKYARKIVFEIPEGYMVSNLNDANFNIEFADKSCGFISNATLSGNIVTIEISEWYSKIEFSVDEYPMYEKAINGAADFNKVVFVLKKK